MSYQENNGINEGSETTENTLLKNSFQMINTFNENFICKDVNTILQLYKKESSIWQHPLILNHNYCLICKEKITYNNTKSNVINNHLQCDLSNFLSNNKIKFRNEKKKKKLTSRRFIKSNDNLLSLINSQNNNDINKSQSDTELFLSNKSNIINNKNKEHYKRNLHNTNKEIEIEKDTENDKILKTNQNLYKLDMVIEEEKNRFSKIRKSVSSKIDYAKNSIFKFFHLKLPEQKNILGTIPRLQENKNHNKNNQNNFENSTITNAGGITQNPIAKSTSSLSDNNFHIENPDKTNILPEINTNSKKNEQCEICLGETKEKFVISCGDFYCKSCIKSLVVDRITNLLHFNKLVCPKAQCQEPIDEPIIKQLLNENDFEKYKQIKKKVNGLKNKSLIPCPFPDCSSFAEELLVKKNIAFCDVGHHFCKNCLKILPKNLEEHQCDKKYDESTRYLMSNRFIKKCPNCRTWVQRDPGGCNNMKCMNIWCNYEFCWICEGMYDKSHYKNPFSICFRLGESDLNSKFSRYKSARIAKCVFIFLFLILILFPIIVALFSYVLIGIYVLVNVLDGSKIKNNKIKTKIGNSLFKVFLFSFYGIIGIPFVTIGYWAFSVLILVVPVFCVMNKRQKED